MMRERIWQFVRFKLQEGKLLPWWALGVRAVLFPIDFFYWRYSKTAGYQILTDEWLIGGIRFSAMALRQMSRANGEVFRIRRDGDHVWLERLDARHFLP